MDYEIFTLSNNIQLHMNRQSKGLSKGPEKLVVQKSCFFLDIQMALLNDMSRGISRGSYRLFSCLWPSDNNREGYCGPRAPIAEGVLRTHLPVISSSAHGGWPA